MSYATFWERIKENAGLKALILKLLFSATIYLSRID